MASKSDDLKFFDKRCVQRNVKLGFISEEDHQKFLKSMPDETGNFDEVPFEDENALPDEIDDEDFEDESAEGQE